jgi:hypothetical protein
MEVRPHDQKSASKLAGVTWHGIRACFHKVKCLVFFTGWGGCRPTFNHLAQSTHECRQLHMFLRSSAPPWDFGGRVCRQERHPPTMACAWGWGWGLGKETDATAAPTPGALSLQLLPQYAVHVRRQFRIGLKPVPCMRCSQQQGLRVGKRSGVSILGRRRRGGTGGGKLASSQVATTKFPSEALIHAHDEHTRRRAHPRIRCTPTHPPTYAPTHRLHPQPAACDRPGPRRPRQVAPTAQPPQPRVFPAGCQARPAQGASPGGRRHRRGRPQPPTAAPPCRGLVAACWPSHGRPPPHRPWPVGRPICWLSQHWPPRLHIRLAQGC